MVRKLLEKITGDPNEKILKKFYPTVEKINALEDKFAGMSDQELQQMTAEFRKRLGVDNAGPYEIDDQEMERRMEEILPEAFAVIREASKRILGLRHFDVQLLGGISLHQGQISEMKTGEGKTLVATLPLYLNALSGRGAHLVTVNDYLARVGAGWMAGVYDLLGMSVGVITHDSSYVYDPDYVDDSQYDKRLSHLHPAQRKEVYDCDIVYGTNNDFGFDYLRDNMAQSLADQVQRDLNFAIIDEADSILIDEARTPLLISAPAQESTDRYFTFAQLVRRLKEEEDYNVDEKMNAVTLTEEGINKMEKWLGMDNIYVEKGIKEVHHIEQALKAHVLFKREKDYVIREGEVVIVDEFTGRLMPGRRYSEGLHQAIEAKEGLKVQRESQTLATITFQNFFRMYRKVSGMTGTAETEAEEFASIYGLETVVIPTHKPMIRKDMNDLVFRTENGKFQAVIKDVLERSKRGQPVLVGTASIEKNEKLADMMRQRGIEPAILNAKNHEREAHIISQAGRLGAVTIATNMAGRGVDIILGGNPPDTSEQEKVKEAGGVHVLGTERHESRRIDNQLRGRAGRQGDPGSSQFYVSAEDDLMRVFGGERMQKIMGGLRVPEDTPVENKVVSRSIESAQKKVEGNNFDIRKHLVQFDNVINKHREAVYRRRREVLELFEGRDSVHSNRRAETAQHSDLSEIVLEMVENEIEQIVGYHTAAEDVSNWELSEIYQAVSTIFPVQEELKDDLSRYMEGDNKKLDKAKARTAIIEHLSDLARQNYNEVQQQFESAELGMNWKQIERGVLLRSIDNLWVEHLDSMDHLRKSVGLRGYGQRDPFVEYKKEAYRLFNNFNDMLQKQVVYSIFKLAAIDSSLGDTFAAPTLTERAKKMSAPAKTMNSTSSTYGGQAGNTSSSEVIASKPKNEQGEKVGRNDPCPCGSGKKYKKCCGS